MVPGGSRCGPSTRGPAEHAALKRGPLGSSLGRALAQAVSVPRDEARKAPVPRRRGQARCHAAGRHSGPESGRDRGERRGGCRANRPARGKSWGRGEGDYGPPRGTGPGGRGFTSTEPQRWDRARRGCTRSGPQARGCSPDRAPEAPRGILVTPAPAPREFRLRPLPESPQGRHRRLAVRR